MCNVTIEEQGETLVRKIVGEGRPMLGNVIFKAAMCSLVLSYEKGFFNVTHFHP